MLPAASQTGLSITDTRASGVTYFFGTNSGSDTLSFGGQSGTGHTAGTVVPLTIGADTAGIGASFTQVAVVTAGGSTYTQFSAGGQSLTILGTNTNVTVTNVSGAVINGFES